MYGFLIIKKMKNNSEKTVRQILKDYLEQNNHRKTPERFAVLDAAYSFSSLFSIQDLSDRLTEMNFPVSRATIYNTLKLLSAIRLVASRRMHDGVFYKASYAMNMCSQICTVCGKVTELKMPEVVAAIENSHLKRFRKQGFSVYVYGVCSSCQAVHTRQKNKENTKNKINTLRKDGKRQS